MIEGLEDNVDARQAAPFLQYRPAMVRRLFQTYFLSLGKRREISTSFCDQNRKIATRFFQKKSTRFSAQKSTRFSDKNQPDSLSRNRLDFSTEINPILCPEIDSILRQNHLRSIIERRGQRILFATRSNALALYNILCLSRRTRTGALRRIAISCKVESLSYLNTMKCTKTKVARP